MIKKRALFIVIFLFLVYIAGVAGDFQRGELEEGKSYIINANATVQCNDSNSDNNFDTRIITIKGKPLQKESSLKIESIYDLSASKMLKRVILSL